MSTIDPKICILAAGTGLNNRYAKGFVQGLLPFHNRPVLSHLIDCCQQHLEIIIAVDSCNDLYSEFMQIAYPGRKVSFVEIKEIDEENIDPGRLLLQCEMSLRSPFFLLPIDVFISEPILPSTENWVGVAQNLFTGIAFIQNFEQFFSALKKTSKIIAGFEALLKFGMHQKVFHSWRNISTTELYEQALEDSPAQQLIKSGQKTYLLGKRVIKYDSSPEVIEKKIARATHLRNCVPNIESSNKHFLTYQFIDGHLLSDEVSVQRFSALLSRARATILHPLQLDEGSKRNFQTNCLAFYKNKTEERIALFFQKTGIADIPHQINGQECASCTELLSKLDWSFLSDGIPTHFHGDWQPENIVLTGPDSEIFIDWRHEFANNSGIGDLYYDLAKMKHALILSGEVVRAGDYSLVEKDSITLQFLQKNNLVEMQSALDVFMFEHNYSILKTDLIVALIYLNIAPLYEGLYSKFCFFLGKLYLKRAITQLEQRNNSYEYTAFRTDVLGREEKNSRLFPHYRGRESS